MAPVRARRLRAITPSMIFVSGSRYYGKVDAIGGVYVTTRFQHVQMLPFVPLGSVLIVTGCGHDRALVLPLVARSVVAGYVRIWTFFAIFVGLALTDEVSPFVGVPIAVAAAVAGAWAWFSAGHVSAEEREKRRIYGTFAGAPIDVARLGDAARGPDAAEAKAWRDEIVGRAEEMITTDGSNDAASYRGLARHTGWQDVAEHAHAATPACQGAALTLARLSTSEGDANARAAAAIAHDRIWSAMRETRARAGQRLPPAPR